jgi:hypothetical protein
VARKLNIQLTRGAQRSGKNRIYPKQKQTKKMIMGKKTLEGAGPPT